MDPVVIAETRKRERHDVEKGGRWTTYRVRKLTEEEHSRYVRDRVITRAGVYYVIETQHTKTDGDKTEVRDWEPWDFAATPDAAIESVIGDTEFFEAVSLHLAHAEAVAQARACRAADQAHRDACEARRNLDRSHRELVESANAEYDKYAKRLAARLDRKYGSERPQARIDEEANCLGAAETRIKAKYGDRVASSREALQEAVAAVNTAGEQMQLRAAKRVNVLDQLTGDAE